MQVSNSCSGYEKSVITLMLLIFFLTEPSFSACFVDSVLKPLADIRTLINLRQSVLACLEKPRAQKEEVDLSSLLAEQRLANKGRLCLKATMFLHSTKDSFVNCMEIVWLLNCYVGGKVVLV